MPYHKHNHISQLRASHFHFVGRARSAIGWRVLILGLASSLARPRTQPSHCHVRDHDSCLGCASATTEILRVMPVVLGLVPCEF